MSILTIVWSAAAATCATLAIMHLYIWSRKRVTHAHLLFSLAALGAAGSALMELWAMQTHLVASYDFIVRWVHVPIFILLISLVWFVVVYFRTALRWLAITISVLWSIGLVINFAAPHSLTFVGIFDLKQFALPWGESFTVAVGDKNPWALVTDFASLLIVVFVAHASIRLWRRDRARRALTIGGSIVFFIVTAGIHTPLVDAGIVKTPYMISLAFLPIIFAMAIELSSDVIRVSELSQEVKSNERRWRTLMESVQLLVVGLDRDGKVNFVNPYFSELTGYPQQEVLGKNWFDHFLPEAARPEVHNAFVEILENDFHPHYQNRIKTRVGGERFVSWSNVRLHDREGEIIGTLSVGQDVTEREAAFEQIKQLKDRLQEENIYLQEEIVLDHNHRNIIGMSSALQYALARVEEVAPTEATVLIEGETGVGKELIARAVHHASLRKDRPLVKVNCAAIPANLIESELFGHERGAFTGADKQRKGRFELADKGTIFLDEIGELPLELQPKLLRVLEDGEFERLGSNDTITVDVRIIAATNRILEDEAKAGRFRVDLYYRLQTYPITIPPLRKRKDDIQPLVQFLVDKFARKLGKRIEKIPTQTLKMLEAYSWPSNVRELCNVIERAVIATRGTKLQLTDKLDRSIGKSENGKTSFRSLEEMEREYIAKVLENCEWQVEGEQGAAPILGLHPNTLRSRMQKLGIKKPA